MSARMQWIAPPEEDVATDTLEKCLGAAANQFRANFGLSAAQYFPPVLNHIFLRFAAVLRLTRDLLLPHLQSRHVNLKES